MPEERKGPRLALWRAERRQTLRRERDIQEGEEQRHALVRVEVGLLQPAVDFGRDRFVRLSWGDRTELAHEVHQRQIRRGTAVGQTVSLHIPHLSPHQTAAVFRQQPRLAHAGLAHDRDDLPLSRHHRVEALVQQRQLPRPSHEGTARPRAMADDSRTLVGDPPDTVHGHRRMGLADLDLPLWLDPHVLLHQVLRRRTEQHRAWRRELPQPHRHLRGLSCGRVEPLRVSPEAVHHHPARVQAQTQG